MMYESRVFSGSRLRAAGASRAKSGGRSPGRSAASLRRSANWASRRLFLVGFLGLGYYTAAFLYATPDTLYIGHDGDFVVESIQLQLGYAASPIDLSVLSPLDGMGALVQPVGAWLHPGCWPFGLIKDVETAKLLSGLLVVAFVFLSSFLLGRALELPPLLSLLGAQFTTVVSFPPIVSIYFHELSLAHWYAIWPFLGVTTALSGLFLVVVLRTTARLSTPRLITAAFGLPIIVLYSILSDPLSTPVLFLPAGVVTCGIVITSPDSRTFWLRTMALVCCLSVLLACGVHDYYRAISGYAARQVFPREIGGEIQQFDRFVAFIFQNAVSGVLVVGLIAACLAILRFGSRPQRGLASSVLFIVASVTVVSLYYVYGGIPWNRPPPSYFEHGAVPMYVLALVLGAWITAQRVLPQRVRNGATDWWEAGSVKRKKYLSYAAALWIPCCASVFVTAITSSEMRSVDAAAPPGPLLQRLEADIASTPGAAFRGSVATVVAVPGGPVARQFHIADEAPFSEELVNLKTQYLSVAPHGLNPAALRRRRIPTLEQYNTLATTPMYYLFSRALSRQHDYQMKNYLLVTRIRPDLLACLGVRFVVTDLEIDHPRASLRVAERNAYGVTMNLYELTHANAGQYSPVTLRVVGTASEAIEQMVSHDFCFQREVTVFDTLAGGKLVPAHEASMSFQNGGVQVTAASSGRSLLLLPLEFSNSLRIVSASPHQKGGPQLLRANVVQTAILFSGILSAKIENRFGMFRDIRGRFRDIADCQDLGIVETGDIAYPQHFFPHAASFSSLPQR